MLKKGPFLFFVVTVFFQSLTMAQKGVTTLGIQYKPIIPNRIIGTFEQSFNSENFESSIKQRVGHSFGMVVRQGLTKSLSFETGLGITQRNFNLAFAVPDSSYEATNKVGFVGYEVPLKGLVFIRLGEQLYMNTALGASFIYFPSEVKVITPIKVGEYFSMEGARRFRAQGALLANIGLEYRTKDKGYFYFGSSYNLPFAPVATVAMSYEYEAGKKLAIDNIRGSYLTLDFRYYFHERPNSEQKKKK